MGRTKRFAADERPVAACVAALRVLGLGRQQAALAIVQALEEHAISRTSLALRFGRDVHDFVTMTLVKDFL